jgi:hypothetical protein
MLVAGDSFSQSLYKKCYSSCAGLPDGGTYLLQSDLVQSSTGQFSYVLFNAQHNNVITSILSRFDSLGNNISLKGRPASMVTIQVSQDSTIFTQTLPLRILRVHDNLFITLSIQDSIIQDTNIYTIFSWLIISSFDSTLTLTRSSRYFLNMPVTHPFLFIADENRVPLKVQLNPDSSRFTIAITCASKNLNSTSSVLVATFDTSGQFINAARKSLAGDNLWVYDLRVDVNGFNYLLVKSDTSFGLLKLDSSLALIQSWQYSTVGLPWVPFLLNLKSNSATIISTQSNFSSVMIIETDTLFNITNSQLLAADSSFVLGSGFGLNEEGIVLFTEKDWIGFQTTKQQDVLFIDSLNVNPAPFIRTRNREFYPAYNVKLPMFGSFIKNKSGFLALISEGYSDAHFGPFNDIFLSQLGPMTEDCNEMAGVPSNYSYVPVTLGAGVMPVLDSAIIFSSDSVSLNYSPSNIFNIFSCTGHVGLPAEEEVYEENFVVFPNPTTGEITVRGNLENSIKAIEILNLIGEKVLVRKNPIGSSEIQVDLNGLSSGVYLLQVISDEKVWRGKVVKE